MHVRLCVCVRVCLYVSPLRYLCRLSSQTKCINQHTRGGQRAAGKIESEILQGERFTNR